MKTATGRPVRASWETWTGAWGSLYDLRGAGLLMVSLGQENTLLGDTLRFPESTSSARWGSTLIQSHILLGAKGLQKPYVKARGEGHPVVQKIHQQGGCSIPPAWLAPAHCWRGVCWAAAGRGHPLKAETVSTPLSTWRRYPGMVRKEVVFCSRQSPCVNEVILHSDPMAHRLPDRHSHRKLQRKGFLRETACPGFLGSLYAEQWL